VKIGPYLAEEPYLVARITEMPDEVDVSPELEALTRNVQRTFSEIIEQIPYLPEELQMAVANVDDPSALSHLIAGALRSPTEESVAARRGRRPNGCACLPISPANWRSSSPVARSSQRSSPRSTRDSANTSARADEGDPGRAL
jgi:hypothetical protein